VREKKKKNDDRAARTLRFFGGLCFARHHASHGTEKFRAKHPKSRTRFFLGAQARSHAPHRAGSSC
jgi:hypothetical protein